jgi:hypothetical protein
MQLVVTLGQVHKLEQVLVPESGSENTEEYLASSWSSACCISELSPELLLVLQAQEGSTRRLAPEDTLRIPQRRG